MLLFLTAALPALFLVLVLLLPARETSSPQFRWLESRPHAKEEIRRRVSAVHPTSSHLPFVLLTVMIETERLEEMALSVGAC